MFCVPVFNMGDFTVKAAADNVLSAAFCIAGKRQIYFCGGYCGKRESRRSNVTSRSSAFFVVMQKSAKERKCRKRIVGFIYLSLEK